jgi:hypothetical protein
VKSILKSVLAILLGLGFLALQSRAQAPATAAKKSAIAFLGLTEASDPQMRAVITQRIRGELAADTGLSAVPAEKIDKLFARGILREPDARPEDPEALRREIGSASLAYASLERFSVSTKRTWWKPWSLKNTWTQGIRVKIMDGATGNVVLDSLVATAVREPGFLFAPEEDWGKVPPLEREKRMRIMAEAVSVEAARVLGNAAKGRVPAAAVAGNVPATPG